MNNHERVTNVIKRQPIDYIPSQINFADFTRNKEISDALGLDEGQSLDSYLGNCLYLTFADDDLPIFFKDFDDMMKDLAAKDFAYINWKDDIVYDRHGIGIKRHTDGFFVCYYPLKGDAELDKIAGEYLPERITKLYGLPLEEKIRKYEFPDADVPGDLDWMLNDFATMNDGSQFILPTGYLGIYERAYCLIEWNQFMLEIALRPNMIYELMEKVTDFKIKQARKKIKETPSIVHHIGDDLGLQLSGFFSLDMFRKVILPHYKRLFEVYKSAGKYVALHSCGCIIDYLPDLIDIGLDMLEPVQACNDLAKLKHEFGKDLILWGGIDTQKMPFQTPDETREMTRETIRTLGKGGGCIIGPSVQITSEVPIENIKAMVETIMEERDKVI